MSNSNTVFDNLKIIYNNFVVKAAEIGAYASSWTPEFSVSCLTEIFDNKHKWKPNEKWFDVEFSQKDFQGLTPDQLISVGFRKWDNDFSFLVPLYLLNYLKIDETYKCISGDAVMVKDFDNDNRYGCLAYYFNLVN